MLKYLKRRYRIIYRHFFPVVFSGKGAKRPPAKNEGDIKLKKRLSRVGDLRLMIGVVYVWLFMVLWYLGLYLYAINN